MVGQVVSAHLPDVEVDQRLLDRLHPADGLRRRLDLDGDPRSSFSQVASVDECIRVPSPGCSS